MIQEVLIFRATGLIAQDEAFDKPVECRKTNKKKLWWINEKNKSVTKSMQVIHSHNTNTLILAYSVSCLSTMPGFPAAFDPSPPWLDNNYCKMKQIGCCLPLISLSVCAQSICQGYLHVGSGGTWLAPCSPAKMSAEWRLKNNAVFYCTFKKYINNNTYQKRGLKKATDHNFTNRRLQ